MDYNQPRRSFKPEVREPAKGQADDLRDRMRTAPAANTANQVPEKPVPDKPIGGDETPIKPSYTGVDTTVSTPETPAVQQLEPPKPIHETWQAARSQQQSNLPPQPEPPALEPQIASEPEITDTTPESSGHDSAIEDLYNQPLPQDNQNLADQPKMPGFAAKLTGSVAGRVKSVKLPTRKASQLSDNQKFFRNIGAGAAIILLVVGVFSLYSHTVGSKNPAIPPELQLKAKFPVYYPPKNSAVKIDKDTYKYDPAAGLLSYVAYTPSGVKLVISEQAAPDNWTTGNPGYDTLLNSLPGVKSFKTANGTANLTHPKNAGQDQFAFMNVKGTMLIIRPTKELPDDEWQKIFNSLEAVKESE